MVRNRDTDPECYKLQRLASGHTQILQSETIFYRPGTLRYLDFPKRPQTGKYEACKPGEASKHGGIFCFFSRT